MCKFNKSQKISFVTFGATKKEILGEGADPVSVFKLQGCVLVWRGGTFGNDDADTHVCFQAASHHVKTYPLLLYTLLVRAVFSPSPQLPPVSDKAPSLVTL